MKKCIQNLTKNSLRRKILFISCLAFSALLVPVLFSSNTSAVNVNANVLQYARHYNGSWGSSPYDRSLPTSIALDLNQSFTMSYGRYRFEELSTRAVSVSGEISLSLSLASMTGVEWFVCERNVVIYDSGTCNTPFAIAFLDSNGVQLNADISYGTFSLKAPGSNYPSSLTVELSLSFAANFGSMMSFDRMNLRIGSTTNSVGSGDSYLYISAAGSKTLSFSNAKLSLTAYDDGTGAILGGLDEQNQLQQENNDAINRGNEQEQERYEREKQEERQREQEASDQASEASGLFNFNVLNPLSGISVSDDCVAVPTLGSWLHLPSNQICPFFPANVRSGVSPIIGILTSILTFGFLWNVMGFKDLERV